MRLTRRWHTLSLVVLIAILALPLLPVTGTDTHVTELSRTGAVSYSDYLGGSSSDAGWGIAVDGQGNAYVTGQTDSPDFPVTTLSPIGITNTASLVHGVCNPLTGLNTGTLTQAITTTGGLCYDAFVTKLSPSYQGLNGRILYSTYLGGGRDDYGYGIATDGQGNAYVTGRTDSPDFPTTTGGNLDRAAGTGGLLGAATYPACHETYCPDAFAARLDTTAGGLITAPPTVWQLTGPVIAGVTSGAGGVLSLPIAGTAGTIVNGPTVTWSRFLGGSGADEGTAVALDPSGNVYVAGDTAPPTAGTTGDFSTPAASDPATATTRAYSTTTPAGVCPTGPCADAFVVKLSNTSSNSQTNGQVVYASRIGGGGDDRAAALAVDTAGHAYVVGSTSSADYPLIGSLQGFAGTQTGSVTTTMAFVTKLNIQGSALWYSSYLGGSGGDAGSAVAVDGIGDVALAGTTGSTDFLSLRPVARQELATQPAQTHLSGSQGQPDAFVASIDATTRYLTYGYDNVDRLTGVTETLGNAYAYSYDPAGNRTDQYLNGVAVQHSQYDGANEAITVTSPRGATIDSYDAAGNLTADSANSYRYDPLNRLIALTPSSPTGATGQPAQPETYAYNGDGTLVAQTGNVPQTGSSAVTTRYTQDLAIQPSAPGANGGPSTGLFAPTGHTPPPSQVLQARVTQTSGGDLVTDYAYGVDTGGNPSRFASNPLGNGTHTWSVADLQGSPRYTQDDSGQPTGAGTPAGALNYDPQPVRYAPYGAIDRGADGNGRVPQTFGYRGELQDANTGLVNLRARTYNPATGQFLTRDPLEQQTGQAYAYAGSNPIANADPTGQDYVATNLHDLPIGVEDQLIQTVKQNFVRTAQRDAAGQPDTLLNVGSSGGAADIVDLSGSYGSSARSGGDGSVYSFVPAINQENSLPGIPCFDANHRLITCNVREAPYHSDLGYNSPDRAGLIAGVASGVQQVVADGLPGVVRAFRTPRGCIHTDGGFHLIAGGPYPDHATVRRVPCPQDCIGPQPLPAFTQAAIGGALYLIVTRSLDEPGHGFGFIEYTICRYQPGAAATCQEPAQQPDPLGTVDLCHGEGFFACTIDLVLFGGSLGDLYRCSDVFSCVGSSLGVLANGALTLSGAGDLARLGISGARLVARGAVTGARITATAGRAGLDAVRAIIGPETVGHVIDPATGKAIDIGSSELRTVVDDIEVVPSCLTGAHCFPAGTLVATPRGAIAIEKLQVGATVFAEDPKTGKVEAEPVQALIVRPEADLMALDLSDGSTIKVQPDHFFWVDGGPGHHRAHWLKARQLRSGDRLRTAQGRDVTILRLRRHVGHAVVYTLTVAHDHTFFVGTARVLVHNEDPFVSCPVGEGFSGTVFVGPAPTEAELAQGLQLLGNADYIAPGRAAAEDARSLYRKVQASFFESFGQKYGLRSANDAFAYTSALLTFAEDSEGSFVGINEISSSGTTDLINAVAKENPELAGIIRRDLATDIFVTVRDVVTKDRFANIGRRPPPRIPKLGVYAPPHAEEFVFGKLSGKRNPIIIGASNRLCDYRCLKVFPERTSATNRLIIIYPGDPVKSP